MKKIAIKFNWKGEKIIWYPIQTCVAISTIVVLLWTIITTCINIKATKK